MQDKRQTILEKIKANGGFWSYCGYIPTSLDDDSVIEAALVHLALEDLPLLLEIWDKAHIKRVWKRSPGQPRQENEHSELYSCGEFLRD